MDVSYGSCLSQLWPPWQEYARLGGLNSKHLSQLGAAKSEVKARADLVSGDGLMRACRLRLLVCACMACPWCGLLHGDFPLSTSPYQGIEPIMETPHSRPYLKLITCQRPHLQILSCTLGARVSTYEFWRNTHISLKKTLDTEPI